MNINKRRGFTMIELIFVIVILGILASVAIPKLAATRDDAEIASMATAIQSARQEIMAQTVASGTIPSNLSTYSNVIADMISSGKVVLSGSNKVATFLTRSSSGTLANCITMTVSGTSPATLAVAHLTPASNPICTNLKSLVSTSSTTIGGSSVSF